MPTKPVITPYVFSTDTLYTTGPVALQGTATKIALSVAERDEGWKADQKPGAQQQNDLSNHVTQWTNWVGLGSNLADVDAHVVETQADGIIRALEVIAGANAQSLSGLGWFGDGDDGDVTIPIGTTTLVRDMVYNNLIVDTSGTLDTDGFRVFVKETLTIRGGILNRGVNGVQGDSGGAGGAGANSNSIGGGSAGGQGGLGGAGTSGTTLTTPGFGNVGGSGGSDGGANAGGFGGTIVVPTTTEGSLRTLVGAHGMLMGGVNAGTIVHGGSGGGGGGGAEGGGGGGSGGVVVVFAKNIVLAGGFGLRASGNNGEGGGNPAANGGGGGGGGGVIWVVSRTSNLTGGDLQVGGGSGGSGTNGGNNGSAGLTGKAIVLSV